MSSRSRLVATSSPSSSTTKSNKNNIEQEHTHLSGAYIRTLVKHLSSSSSTARSRGGQHLMSTTMTNTIPADHHRSPTTPQRQEKAPAQKAQIKKQVRRRLQTSRPYQERLLNMAEARREIVTALKIHRANMRRQSMCQQQEQLQPPMLQLEQQQQVQVVFQEQSQQAVDEASMATMSYASFSTNHLCSSPLAQLIGDAPAGSCYSSSMLPYLPPFDVPVAMGDMDDHGGFEYWACSLPAQALGLNLSFQGLGGFVDDDAKNSNDLIGLPLIQPSSPASCYSAFSAPAMAMVSHGSPAFLTAENAPVLCGPVLDAEEMHGIEWVDTAVDVAAAPARWSKIVESTESAGGEGAAAVVSMEDSVMACLPELLYDGDFDDGEEGVIIEAKAPDVLEMRLDDGDVCCYRDGHGDAADDIALPCMGDIGDIEGWEDGEWFS